MTYLEVVNEVLTRLRQDPITGIIGEEDESAKMVIKLVNDAKTKVENAHNWSVLRKEWDITTVDSQKRYDLPDSHNYIKVECMSNEDAGYWVDQTSTKQRKQKHWGSQTTGAVQFFTVSGAASNGNATVDVWPLPKAGVSLSVEGFQNQDTLTADGDILLVPALPVIYEALAMAARERGEVGGQTSLEIFGVAKQYLMDAVALDGALSPLDNIWYSV